MKINGLIFIQLLRVLPLIIILVFIFIEHFRNKQLTYFFLWKNLNYLITLSIFLLYQITTFPIMNVGFRFFVPVFVLLVFWLLDQKELASIFKRKSFNTLFSISIIISSYFTYQDISMSYFYKNDHVEFEMIGKKLATVSGITIASSEAGKLAFYSGENHFFDSIGLNNYFVAKNYKKDDYSLLLAEYFNAISWPNIYIRPKFGIGAGDYAYLENAHGFSLHYRCYDYKNLKVCIENISDGKIRHILFPSTTPTELKAPDYP